MSRLVACCLAGLLPWLAAAAGPAADPQGPPAASASSATTLEPITVTGSYIRRTNTESPSPITTINADDIEKSGLNSISDVIKTISADNSGTLSQAFSGAMAGGADGVALRGLTVDATLVLLDGHRMANYPLTDDGQRQFVDIDSLPMAIVDRVEVLKDGASATYGSDAIAGVVNVILKKEFTGLDVSATAGSTDRGDGLSQRFAATWGTGSLEGDGHNLYVSIEGRHQQAIPQEARGSYIAAEDLTPWGGPNLYGGVITGSLPNPLTTYTVPGQVLPLKGGVVQNQTPFLLPGCSAADAALATDGGYPAGGCAWDTNAYKKLQPRTAGLDLSTRWSQMLGGGWSNSLSASYYLTQSEQYRQPNAYNVGTALVPFAWAGATAGTVNQYDPATTRVVLPANSLDNPFNPASPYFAAARNFYGSGFSSYTSATRGRVLRRPDESARAAHDVRNRRLPGRRRPVEQLRRVGFEREHGLRARRHAHHLSRFPVRTCALHGGAGERLSRRPETRTSSFKAAVNSSLVPETHDTATSDVAFISAHVTRKIFALPGGDPHPACSGRRRPHDPREQSRRARRARGRHSDGRQLLRARRAVNVSAAFLRNSSRRCSIRSRSMPRGVSTTTTLPPARPRRRRSASSGP